VLGCARVYLSLVCAVSFGYVQGCSGFVQGLFKVGLWGCLGML